MKSSVLRSLTLTLQEKMYGCHLLFVNTVLELSTIQIEKFDFISQAVMLVITSVYSD